MKIWNDLSVRTKLTIMVAIACLALVAIGLMGIDDLHTGNENLKKTNQSMNHVAYLGAMKSDFLAMRLDLVYMMALKEQAQLNEKWSDFSNKTIEVRESLRKLESRSLDKDEVLQITQFKEGFEQYVVKGLKLGDMLLDAHASGNAAKLQEAISYGSSQVGPLYAKPAEILARMVASNIKEGEETFAHDLASYKRSIVLDLGVILFAVVCTTTLGIFITLSITKPLSSVLENLKQLAAGDLSARCSIDSKDEMGRLAQELNTMSVTIHGVISRVTQNGLEVSSAATQLRATSEEMATGAEQAAAQTQTIATASEEMAATSSDIANNCHMAASNAQRVNEAAETSAKIVDGTITIMSQIAGRVKESAALVETLGSRSEEIGEIVGTIEDIADQTNLLALNAAIEAARAGEQGRGFAVVADEVRALAERTTVATKQIAQTIKSIQQETRNAVAAMDQGVREVELGTRDAAKSGTALESILAQIGDLSMQVNQIATAAEEQTATTGEITNNIQQITAAVQVAANGSQESAAASAQLARLSEDLRSMMSHFKINS